MAEEVKSGTPLGYVDFGGGKTFDCIAIGFEGINKLFVAQKVTQDGINGYKIRGKQFVLSTAASFRQANGITDADLAVLEAGPGDGGYNAPESFKLPVGLSTKNAGTPDTFIYNTKDTDLDGVEDVPAKTGFERSGDYLTQVWDYAKSNPMTAVAIVAALGYLVHLYIHRNRKKKPKYLGLL